LVEQLNADHVQLIVPPGSHEQGLDDRLETIRRLGADVAAPLRSASRNRGADGQPS